MVIGIDASRAATAQKTGTEGYAYHLIRAVAPLAARRGHQLTLYYNRPPDQPLTEAAHTARPLPQNRLWTHARLARELHTRPPDVFFTPAHVIPLSYRAPSVATIHDVGFRHYPDAHTANQRRYLEWSTRHNAQRARLILADSAATKADVVAFYGISAEKIHVVYPAFAPELSPNYSPAPLSQLGIRFPFLLTLGTLQPRKNIGRLIDAFASVAHVLPHQLVLAGKMGWLSDSVRDAIDAQPAVIQQRIVTTGFIDDEAKAALLTQADALLFPSLYEGFGFPVLEAQRCGTPVLCAARSSLLEVGAASATMVEPESARSIASGIMETLANRSQLVAAGYRNVARFDWRVSAEKTLNLLEQAAGA